MPRACEHAAFSARLSELAGRARAGDWRDLEREWAGFVGDLDEHMSSQESRLFGHVAKQIRSEHDAIRHLLKEISAEIEVFSIRPCDWDLLAHVLDDCG